jgi:uncharacterized membrane protein
MKKKIATSLIAAIAFAPPAYLLAFWNSIPEKLSLNFALNKTIEEVSSRKELLIVSGIIALISILMYLLLSHLNRVDPKVGIDTPRSTFNKLGLIVALFLVATNFYLVLSVIHQWVVSTSVIVGFSGLLITLLGNYMNNLRPNYVAGIRLPWTLNDPENWKQTHQLAAKLWFGAGIVIMACSLFISQMILLVILIVLVLLIVIIPGIYSFQLYRRKNRALI